MRHGVRIRQLTFRESKGGHGSKRAVIVWAHGACAEAKHEVAVDLPLRRLLNRYDGSGPKPEAPMMPYWEAKA